MRAYFMICPHSARKAGQRGQGMTEYIIIVALIAAAAIGVFQFFGQTIRNQAAGISKEVSGQSASTEITSANSSAGNATTEGTSSKGLGTYQNDANRGQ
jgi:Flp pilus assembly pilin Flp